MKQYRDTTKLNYGRRSKISKEYSICETLKLKKKMIVIITCFIVPQDRRGRQRPYYNF